MTEPYGEPADDFPDKDGPGAPKDWQEVASLMNDEIVDCRNRIINGRIDLARISCRRAEQIYTEAWERWE